MSVVITIDGPSGAGKGTICRLLAEATGYHLLDSGALYRLTALASLNSNIDLSEEDAVAEVAKSLDVAFIPRGNETEILLAGANVSADIRKEDVGMAASKVAALPAVRKALLQRQRNFLEPPGLIADGRDMGTVVFPEAPLKIFLTASAQERANRRVKQLQSIGEPNIEFEKILADIEKRDDQDRNRASSPLIPAADAELLDSTSLSIEQVKDVVLKLAAVKKLI